MSAAASQKKHPASGKGYKNEMGIQISIRRVVALSLCSILVFCSAYHPAYAGEVAAASVAVQGAQLITGGLVGQKAVDYIAPKMAPVVGGVLQGCGIKTHVVGETTPSQFVTSKVSQFCGAVGYSLEKFWTTIAKGCFIAQSGAIQLSHEASELVSQFGSWLFTREGEVVPEISDSPAQDAATAGGYNFSKLMLGEIYTGISTGYSSLRSIRFESGNSNTDMYILQCIDGIFVCSTAPIDLRINYLDSAGYVGRTGRETSDSTITGTNIYRVTRNFTGFNVNSVSDDLSTVWHAIHSAGGDLVINPGEAVPGQDVFVGTPEAWGENKDLLNPGAASETVTTLDPDVLNPIIDQLQAGHAYDITITSYLDALAKAFDRVADATVAVRDRVTAIEDAISVPTAATEDLTVTLDVTSPTVTPAVAPEEVNYDGAIDGVSFDLTRIFPFCIPFDVVAACQLFDAEPQAPHFEIHETLPYNIPFDIVLDLSDFDGIASICRKLELVLFVVGLAVVTRSLFIRA